MNYKQLLDAQPKELREAMEEYFTAAILQENLRDRNIRDNEVYCRWMSGFEIMWDVHCAIKSDAPSYQALEEFLCNNMYDFRSVSDFVKYMESCKVPV